MIRLLKVYKKLSGVLVLGSLSLGLALAAIMPTHYTAEVRVAVGALDLSAQSVPGYAEGVRTLTATYARYVLSNGSQGASFAKLPAQVQDDAVDISATPIPESNIIRLQVVASTATSANAIAEAAAVDLETAVAGTATPSSEVLSNLQLVSGELAQARAAVTVAERQFNAVLDQPESSEEQLRAAQQNYVEASTELAVATAKQTAVSDQYRAVATNSGRATTLQTISPAVVIGDDRRARLQMGGLGGLVVGFVAALIVSAWRGRSRVARQAILPLSEPDSRMRSRRDSTGDRRSSASDDIWTSH